MVVGIYRSRRSEPFRRESAEMDAAAAYSCWSTAVTSSFLLYHYFHHCCYCYFAGRKGVPDTKFVKASGNEQQVIVLSNHLTCRTLL